MTVGQIISDALGWCRFFAVNNSIGRPEVKLIWYEAFQSVYDMAVMSHPDYFRKSVAFSGASFAIPADMRQEEALVVDDAGCTSGYAKVVERGEWAVRQSNTRNKGTATDPIARKDAAVFTLSNSVSGKLYYIRTFAESALTDETKDLSEFLPLVFHPVVLSKMQQLIRVRHANTPENPSEAEQSAALARSLMQSMRVSLKPLNVIEALSEKPLTTRV